MSRALFLDRDGVINHDLGYAHKKEDFVFCDGIFELTRRFVSAGYMIFVITNQAGIAKGYFSESDFFSLTQWMLCQFKKNGINIDSVYHCPFHPEGVVIEYKKDSFDRKPNPGMILRARDEFSIELSRSILIGDRESDIQAGKTAGIGLNVIVGEPSNLADLYFENINDAYHAEIWEYLK